MRAPQRIKIQCPRCLETREVVKQRRKTALCHQCSGELYRKRTLPLRSRLEEDRL